MDLRIGGQRRCVSPLQSPPGGVGRARLAIEYVYRYESDYEVVCAVPVGRPARGWERDNQGGWVENSAAMEGYFEDGDGWEENALVKVL